MVEDDDDRPYADYSTDKHAIWQDGYDAGRREGHDTPVITMILCAAIGFLSGACMVLLI